jgi:hypothetical protein
MVVSKTAAEGWETTLRGCSEAPKWLSVLVCGHDRGSGTTRDP